VNLYDTISSQAPFEPTGDQPKRSRNSLAVSKWSPLPNSLGATGTGKTFSVAAVIEKVGKPTLVLAHNKT